MRYWIYLNGEVPGQYEPGDLIALPGFADSALVCPSEGELGERRWQPAGSVPEIVAVLRAQPAAEAPQSRPSDPMPAADPSEVVDQTSLRLFRHISQLMREIESHRNERSLLQSLQANVVQLKEELDHARRELASLQDRAGRVAEYERRCSDLENALSQARQEAAAQNNELRELRERLERNEQETASAKIALYRAQEEKQSLSQQAEELSRVVKEKDLSLAKTLASLSHVDHELSRMLRSPAANVAPVPVRDEPKPEARLAEIDPEPPREPAAKPPEPRTKNVLNGSLKDKPGISWLAETPRSDRLAEGPVEETPRPPDLPEETTVREALSAIEPGLAEALQPEKVAPRLEHFELPPPVPVEDSPAVIEIAPPWRQALDKALSSLQSYLSHGKARR